MGKAFKALGDCPPLSNLLKQKTDQIGLFGEILAFKRLFRAMYLMRLY